MHSALSKDPRSVEDADDMIWKILKYCEATPSNHQELQLPSIHDNGGSHVIEGHTITSEWMLRVMSNAKVGECGGSDSGYGSMINPGTAQATRDNSPDIGPVDNELSDLHTEPVAHEKNQTIHEKPYKELAEHFPNEDTCISPQPAGSPEETRSPVSSPLYFDAVVSGYDRCPPRAASCPVLDRHLEQHHPIHETQSNTPESAISFDSDEFGHDTGRLQSRRPDFSESVNEENSTRADLLELIAGVDDMLQRTRNMISVNSASACNSARSSPPFRSRHRSRSSSRLPRVQQEDETRTRARTEPPQPLSISADSFRNAIFTADASPARCQESNAPSSTPQNTPISSKPATSAIQAYRTGKRTRPDDYEDDEPPESPGNKRRCTDLSVNDRFPCIFSAGEPSKYTDSAHLKKFSAISLLR